MQAVSMALRTQGKTVGLVPTMGALHEGHLALMREARQRADVLVASVFVNPLQFDRGADFSRYPRTFETDRLKCQSAGVDVIFMPHADAMYPADFATQVDPGPLASVLEGKSRPGHFAGVATVCTKLFHLVQPHFSVFGEKDYQQLLVLRRLVRDLSTPVEIVAMPVMRDVDGLALSSRNALLSPAQRERATCLYDALTAAQDRVQAGERRAASVTTAAKKILEATPGFTTDYCVVVDPISLEPIKKLDGVARLLIAGSFGRGKNAIRLLDNGPLFAS
jgi:pantoate--beta-alanine ligase